MLGSGGGQPLLDKEVDNGSEVIYINDRTIGVLGLSKIEDGEPITASARSFISWSLLQMLLPRRLRQ